MADLDCTNVHSAPWNTGIDVDWNRITVTVPIVRRKRDALGINHWTRSHGRRLKTEARKRRKPGEPVGHEQDKDAKENASTKRERTR